jgi:ferric-dicitrate binding protein FerR (iron transport regulator)
LLKQYLDSHITPEELDELMLMLQEDGLSGLVQASMEELIGHSSPSADYEQADWDPLYQKIMAAGEEGVAAGERDLAAGEGDMAAADGRVAADDGRVAADDGRVAAGERKAGVIVMRSKKWVAVAAAVILLLLTGGGWLLFYKGGQRTGIPQAVAVAKDAAPGRDKAVLTLADGSTVDLDSAKEGWIGRQGASQVIKRGGGQLAYQVKTGNGNAATANGNAVTSNDHAVTANGDAGQYNILTTPRGGQYQLILPDGSKVWLNAASSIRYPTAFTGGERVVELKGEAYFEVVKNAARPFRVSVVNCGQQHGSGGEAMQVEVLGTHFNIMAYTDEQTIRTTLLEGSVRVRRGAVAKLVKPGEQARLDGAGSLKVAPADTQEAVAWKDGLFKFNEATIDQVMRQLSRWYDVEVVYVNPPPKDLFRGEMYRNVNASAVLKVLEVSGVHFRVEGKKILVQ